MAKTTKPQTHGILHGDILLSEKIKDLDTKVTERNYPSFLSAAHMAWRLNHGIALKVNCRGDSTMFGATVGNLGAQDPQNAPATFKKTILNLYGVECRVINNGISGSTLRGLMSGTDGAVPSFLEWLPHSDDDVIFCNHGINDSQLDLSIDQYRRDLIEFVRQVRKYGKVPVLCTPNPCPPTQIIDELKTKRLDMFVRVMRDVADAMCVDLVDQYYYYMQTSRMVPLTELVPDGAHPSSDAYAMSGRNMAIPFVQVKTLRKAGDKQGLANGTYFDNIKSNRQLRHEATPMMHFGSTLVGTKVAENTGVNMAVLLDAPTDDTTLAMYGTQWGSGSKMNLVDNGVWTNQFNGAVNQASTLSTINWEAVYLPTKCELYAGLHVMGMLGDSGSLGAGDYAISGWGLLPRTEAGAAYDAHGKVGFPYMPICNGIELNTVVPFFNSGTIIELCASVDGTSILKIEGQINGKITITTRGGPSHELTGAANVQAGSYPLRLRFHHGTTNLSISFGTLSMTIPVAETFPNMFVKGIGLNYVARAVL